MGGCNSSTAAPINTHQGTDFKGATNVGEGYDYDGSLEDAVQAEWDDELDGLFDLWTRMGAVYWISLR